MQWGRLAGLHGRWCSGRGSNKHPQQQRLGLPAVSPARPSLLNPLQVVESLLHPSTLERLQAIRRYVEQPDGEFPPAPTTAHLPVPLYGYTKQQALEW